MTNQQTRWMSIREAALALGVSELTVRRRIKDGKLTHRSENGKYYVDLETAPAEPQAPPTPLRAVEDEPEAVAEAEMIADTDEPKPVVELETSDDQAPAVTTPINLDQLLREHARLAEIAGRAAAIEEQLRALESRHAALQDGVISLSNRNGWLEGRLEDREREVKLLSDNQRRVSWWRRLFGAAPASS